MYRQYENPYTLEEKLKDLREQRQNLVDAGYTGEDLVDIDLDIHELEERVNFAWQDEEYEEDCTREALRLGEAWFNEFGEIVSV